MSDIVIKVENLSKQYRIGSREGYKTFRETLVDAAKAPFSALRSGLSALCSLPSARSSQLSSRDNTFWALRDVSFEVKQGEVIGIIGRNGAGKSTLLKILSQITEPTEGKVELRGRVGSLLEVGTGFHPELTGHENVYLYGAILGMDRWEVTRKFDEIVAFAELEKFIETPVKRYSSGMYMRLAFAVAAHLEPEILLVDEVLAVGDAAFQKKCLGKMDAVSKEGRTVLFVSHNMSGVQRLCHRAVLLLDGDLIMDGETSAVIEQYLSTIDEVVANQTSVYDFPRSSGLGETIRFSKCIIFDSKEKENHSLRFGEPFDVYLELIAKTELKDLSVVVGIDSFDENRIASAASEEHDILFAITPERPLRINVQFRDIVLSPGIYWLTISIRSGRVGLDQLVRVTKFEVSIATFDGVSPHSGVWGYIRVEPLWKQIDNEFTDGS